MTEPTARIAAWQEHFDKALLERLPAEYRQPDKLHRAMRYSALAGGKRFRPILVYATGSALGLPLASLDPIAVSIELIHTYSLIHDDLPAMDDDDLRRGHPTCHRAFDEATAILAGDALQALAFEVLARELPATQPSSLEIVLAIATACGSTGMAGGQALDLGAVGKEIDEQALKTMHRLKTGALIQASVIAPCILANSSARTRQALSDYGDSIGLAFQVHDDILDITGTSEVIGKNTLSDAAQGKPTFPTILGLDESRQQAEELRERAVGALNALDGDCAMLTWLAGYVISRDR